MGRFRFFIEDTRKELLSKVNKQFIGHGKKTRELPLKNKSGSKYKRSYVKKIKNKKEVFVEFETKSATGKGSYTQTITILGLYSRLKKLKNRRTSNIKKTIDEAIKNNDLKIYCECPAFLYWGYKYINTQEKNVPPKRKENRPPDIRNPKRKGIMCKHLNLVLDVFPFNSIQMAKELENEI